MYLEDIHVAYNILT